MAKPTFKPEIATLDVNLPNTGNPNKSRPTVTLRDTGYDKGQKPAVEEYNWLFDNVNDWIIYLESVTDISADALLSANNLSDVVSASTAFTNIKQAATTTATGVVELATGAETATGTDSTRAITPLGLLSRTATETRTGVVELATDAETQTGTDTTRAITPSNLSARTATETRTGVVELATQTEVNDGADTVRVVTPETLKVRLQAIQINSASVIPSLYDSIGAHIIAGIAGTTVVNYGDLFAGSALFGIKIDSAASDGRLDSGFGPSSFPGTWRVTGAGINNGRLTAVLAIRIG